ncbi:MAG: hypothetical protein IJC49_06420 [Clostridia bacterium]|nr:hypothetical protein [Clostridia bacterium]
MDTFVKFVTEFLSTFFGALWSIFTGIFNGFIGMFNVMKYVEIFKKYCGEFDTLAWILAIVTVVLLVAALVGLGFVVYLLIRKYIRVRTSMVSQEELLNEVGRLNNQVIKLSIEKDKILAMKVSQIGLQPGDEAILDIEGEKREEKPLQEGESRFFKLTQVDQQMANYVAPEYDNEITLSEICDRFRNFACSRMGLFYEIRIIRLFVAALASTRLVILQGISGTGKTSLPYSFGKFLQNDAQIASVQPSWRDRSELYGYFNEFTKRFNETETLRKMYEAKYTEDVYLTILDEMNIARIEYYFAEMLSILEMPTRDEWVVDLVPSQWPNDPKFIVNGRMKLPENMWYVGTANNDDSTFAISDKVYDRALPINIDTKGKYFQAPPTDPLRLSYKHLESMFEDCKQRYKVSNENLEKINKLDDYVIEHFRLAFGNRIVKQLRDFVPAYVGCGGTEIDGIDYVLANKILRKFESLNLAFIRDEIDGLIDYLSELFGEENMGESKAYLQRLQKTF